MNRRQFLVAAAAVSVAANALAAPQREIRKALKWGMIQEPKAKSVLDKLRLIADCGFQGVEFSGPVSIPLREIEQAGRGRKPPPPPTPEMSARVTAKQASGVDPAALLPAGASVGPRAGAQQNIRSTVALPTLGDSAKRAAR